MIDEKAQRWAEIIMAVRIGKISATEAARELSVSRKTYYEKENRALTALAQALQDQPSGRPAQETDKEKTVLQKKVKDLEEENLLLRSSLRIRDVMRQAETEGEKEGTDSDDHARTGKYAYNERSVIPAVVRNGRGECPELYALERKGPTGSGGGCRSRPEES